MHLVHCTGALAQRQRHDGDSCVRRNDEVVTPGGSTIEALWRSRPRRLPTGVAEAPVDVVVVDEELGDELAAA
jgi:hypothetical protein